MINISMGYFFYDTFAMILTNTHDTFILIHHSLVISGIYVCLLTNIAATDIMAGFFISEVSNPFMHIKEIMKTLGLSSTRFFLWNEISFYVIYLIFRIPVGIPIVYDICISETSPIFMKFVAFCILLQSLKWSYTMINILQKRYDEIQWRAERKI